MDAEKWLEQATSKIEFPPDRAAVRRELADHLRDKAERCAARGLTPEEAEGAAVAGMGDPAEVAEALGRLHAPWWGYLWRASQWVLGLAVFALVFSLLIRSADLGALLRSESHLWELYPETAAVSPQRLPGHVKAGAYTVSASSALWEQDGERMLFLSLRFVPRIPWEPVNTTRLYRTGLLSDDEGGRYTLGSGGIKDMGVCGTGPVRWLEFCLRLEGEPPAWVDIALGSHTLRVDLEQGVSLV